LWRKRKVIYQSAKVSLISVTKEQVKAIISEEKKPLANRRHNPHTLMLAQRRGLLASASRR
jgi:hypothetical protein